MKLPWGLLRLYLRLNRGMTLGARVAVFDARNRVLLVNTTYDPRWILPGGGVDRGETVEQAALRELREEASIVAEAPLQWHGFFSNEASFRGDHLACFIARTFRQDPWRPNAEIKAIDFFDVDKLPGVIDPGSLNRIREISDGNPPSPHW
jgi:8-oxo-dGTP pyrophosphatase MutT (NUDIX family)